MLKVLKSKDCKKPKTKKCARALTKYAKKRYSKTEEVVKKEEIDVKAGSNNKIQIGTGNTMGSSKVPTGILNSLGGSYKTTSSLPQYSHGDPFGQSSGLSNPTLGYNSTANRWFAPQPAPTMMGSTTRFPTQPNYNSLFARLRALEKDREKPKTSETGTETETETGTGTDAETQFQGVKQYTPIKDDEGKITGYRKPAGKAPKDTGGVNMKWNKKNPDGNELWKNPESSSSSNIPKGWVTAYNDAGEVWNEDTAQYERDLRRRGGDGASGDPKNLRGGSG